MAEKREFARYHARVGITAQIQGQSISQPAVGSPINISRSGAYLWVPSLPPGAYQIEFSDTASAIKAPPRVQRECTVLSGRNSTQGHGVALKFGLMLAQAELGELAAPPDSNEAIELAKSDRAAVNAELGVIRTCRGQIFIATLTAIGVWVMGAVGLGLGHPLERHEWIAIGAAFPYLVLSISILCLIEKANSISARKAFLSALEDYLRNNRSPPNYLGWNQLSINHDSCRARARRGLCVRNAKDQDCRCFDGTGEPRGNHYAPPSLGSTFDRFGTLAAVIIAPLYIASSALLYWYCSTKLFGPSNGMNVGLGIVIAGIVAFLGANIYSMVWGNNNIASRYLRWKRALLHCRTIDGISLGPFKNPNAN
jgi:hypothetical protein